MFGTKGMIVLGIVAVCFVSLAIVARNWSCRKQRPPRPPRPPRTIEYSVQAVPNGASLVVAVGRKGRHTASIALIGVSAPADVDPLSARSRDSLASLAGKTIRIEVARRLRNPTADRDEEAAAIAEAREFEALGQQPTSPAIAYGETGICLNLEQVRLGLARLEAGTVPKEWQAAEKEAKTCKRGIWGTGK